MSMATALDSLINPKKVIKHVWRKTRIGSVALREEFDAFYKPQYAWGLVHASRLAKALGHSRISAIEFGVAQGKGLVAMDQLAGEIRQEFGIRIDCYGFDTASGLPKPVDFRDAPYLWKEGEFAPCVGDAYEYKELREKLSHSELLIGDVSETVSTFCNRDIAPIGFISFDLDLYTSTCDAFKIFNAGDGKYLPRVPLYFDDVSAPDGFINEFMGELLAINEFNSTRSTEKIAKIHGFELYRKIPSAWNIGAYAYHRYEHPQYNTSTY